MSTEISVSCGSCMSPLAELPDTPAEKRSPCPKCRSLARAFNISIKDEISMHSFVDVKKKSPEYPSNKKLRIHLQQGDQFNHGTGKWVVKTRLIDKDKSPAVYFESVVDSTTGEVLHHSEESLKKHTGHGLAKKK